MAIQEDTSADRKKSIDATDELATINLENMQNNTRVINYCRTFMSIIGGVIAGILGFTGLTGFIFYFIVMAITSAGLAAKAEFSVHSYFDSWNRITLDGFLAGLMVYSPRYIHAGLWGHWATYVVVFGPYDGDPTVVEVIRVILDICLRLCAYFLRNPQ